MASKYGQNDYSLLGKAKIDVSNIENDTNKIVSNLFNYIHIFLFY